MYKFCGIIVSLLLFVFLNQVHCKDVQCLANIGVYPKIKTFDNLDKFTDSACAQCYWFMADNLTNHWRKDSIVNSEMRPIYEPEVYMCFYNTTVRKYNCHPFKYSGLNLEDKENDLFLSQFASNRHMELFLKCCSDAKYCCESVQSSENAPDPKNCPAQWEGWSCMYSAKPDTTELSVCPDMYYMDSDSMPSECARNYISKKCTSNGTWSTHYENISSIIYQIQDVNYEICGHLGSAQRTRESHLYIVGYSFSLLLTLIGSLIFLAYKQYKLLRVQIHLNFFVSLMLSCIFSILYYSQKEQNQSNEITCKTMTVLHKSSHLFNYCWMLIEGIYLHQLIATIGSVREKRRTLYYYVFGWGTTPVIMIVYICVHSMRKYNNKCWFPVGQLAPDIIWETLALFCIGTNAILLINVIRVLFTKLSSTSDHLKAGLKATLSLIPLYGIQFLFYVIPFDPLETCSGGLFFLRYAEIMVASLQGAMITAIFCFFNREVHINIKRSFRRRFPKKDISEMVTEEQGFSNE